MEIKERYQKLNWQAESGSRGGSAVANNRFQLRRVLI